MRSIKKALVLSAVVAAGVAFAPASAEAQEIYDVSQLTEKPRIASPMAAQRAIQSAYPRALQSAGTEGRVVLQFVVQPDGKVDAGSIQVQEAEVSALGEAAREAVQKIEFVPGRVSGSAVSTRVVFPISFVAG